MKHYTPLIVMCTIATACAFQAPWDDPYLEKVPNYEKAEYPTPAGIKAIFMDGPDYQGRPTKIFAYIGIPKEASSSSPVPAIVLVHGGGGSAYIPWVDLWVKRGYAAIAMDTCGNISGGGHNNHTRGEFGGPVGWGGFDQTHLPTNDQWMYHAVSSVLLAHSLIASLPEVDPSRTGLTGISWGGVIASIAGSIDPRFKGVVPVYGCGFVSTDSAFAGEIQKLGKEQAQLWTQLWDPSSYLSHMKPPMLWVTGTNDFAFPLSALMSSAALVKSPQFFCITSRMKHGHGGPGENPPEIRTFFDALFLKKPQLPVISAEADTNRNISCVLPPGLEIAEISLNETTEQGPPEKRLWTAQPLNVSAGDTHFSATVSPQATAAFINIKTTDSNTSSTRVFFFNASEPHSSEPPVNKPAPLSSSGN